MIKGIDALALAHPKFPVGKIINLVPADWALGCFDDDKGAFGNAVPAIRTVLKKGGFKTLRIQAHWSNTHAIVPIEKLKKKLPTYEKLKQDFPDVAIYVSHSCEYQEYNKGAVQKRVDMVRRLAPSCIPVNSVWKGVTTPGAITEHHGDTSVKPGEIISCDGINCYDIDILDWQARNSKALIQFLWGYRYNLREINKPGEPVPPPAARTAVPSAEYIKSVNALFEDPGKPPPYSGPGDKVKPLIKPRLWKSHSEDSMGHDDPRENRPVAIMDVQNPGDYLDIVGHDGTLIGKLRYGGTFDGGLFRYYSGSPGGVGLYGYQIAEKATQRTSYPWVWLRHKKQVWGPIHPAFRRGYFR